MRLRFISFDECDDVGGLPIAVVEPMRMIGLHSERLESIAREDRRLSHQVFFRDRASIGNSERVFVNRLDRSPYVHNLNTTL
jgi:hypothetical protein